jgi:Tfp pilus assembly protein PilO
MTSLSRIVRERRAVLLPLVVLALVNVGLFAFAVYPLSLRASSLEREAESASRVRLMAGRDLAAARNVATGRERADRDLREFYRDVLPPDLAGARRITYARLAQMAREAGLRYDRRRYETDSGEKGATLERLGITMTLEGDYAGVRSFIHALETAPEFVVIEGVSLAERPQGEDVTLTLDLALATYYRAEPHGN